MLLGGWKQGFASLWSEWSVTWTMFSLWFARAVCATMCVRNWVSPSCSSGFLTLKGPAPSMTNQKGLRMKELAQEVQYEPPLWSTTNSGYNFEISYKVRTVIEPFSYEKYIAERTPAYGWHIAKNPETEEKRRDHNQRSLKSAWDFFVCGPFVFPSLRVFLQCFIYALSKNLVMASTSFSCRTSCSFRRSNSFSRSFFQVFPQEPLFIKDAISLRHCRSHEGVQCRMLLSTSGWSPRRLPLPCVAS